MSQKVNLSKYDPKFAYETRDYFCSVKFECDEEEYQTASALAQEICNEEIKKSVLELDQKMRKNG